jgi:hypothetical protein
MKISKFEGQNENDIQFRGLKVDFTLAYFEVEFGGFILAYLLSLICSFSKIVRNIRLFL